MCASYKTKKGKKQTKPANLLFHVYVYEFPVRLFLSCSLGSLGSLFQIFIPSFIVISFFVEFLCTDTSSLFPTLLICIIIDKACCTAMLFISA